MYTSATVFINFECKYDSFYENIEASQIEIEDDAVDVETVAEGKFEFTLTQYVDRNLTTAANSSVAGFGNDLFFQLTMQATTPQLIYSIIGKTTNENDVTINLLTYSRL